MFSTRAWTCAGGGGVKRDTVRATAKLRSMPMVPIPSGEMPNSHFSGMFAAGFTNLK